jgi:uncharacterized membrane protein
MYCGKCGAQNPDNNSFCGKCGHKCNASAQYSQSSQSSQNSGSQNTGFKGTDYSSVFDPADIEANKIASLFAYILFFIPLIVCPNSKFGRFHANQGLIIFIAGIMNSVLQAIINGIFWAVRWGSGSGWWWNAGWFFNPFSIIPGAIGFALLAAVIYGIVNAANGKAVEIPVIGKLRLIT